MPIKPINTALKVALLLVVCLCQLEVRGQKGDLLTAMELSSSGDTAIAKELLRKVLLKSPKNSLAAWQLGNILQKELKGRFLYPMLPWKEQAETVQNLYALAASTANKRNIRKNKDAYQLKFGSKKVSIDAVRMFFEQELSSYQAYQQQIDHLLDINEQISLQYGKASELFAEFKKEYPHLNMLKLSIDAPGLAAMKKLKAHADSTEQLIELRKSFCRKNNLGPQNQLFILNQIAAFEAPPIALKSFTQPQVSLYDFALWSGRIISEVENIILPLKKELLTIDALLSVRINSLSSGNQLPFQQQTSNPNQFIFRLFKADANSLGAKVILYKKSKLAYLQIRKAAQTSEDPQAVAGSQRGKLTELQEILSSISPDEESVQKYQAYLNKVYGGKEGLTQYLISEKLFISQEMGNLLNMSGDADWMASGQREAQDYESESLDPGLAQTTGAQGKTTVLQQWATPDQMQYELGYGLLGSARQEVYVKANLRGNPVWQRRIFYQKSGQAYSSKLTAFHARTGNMLMLGIRSGYGPTAKNRLVGLQENGALLFDKTLEHNMVVRKVMPKGERAWMAVLKGFGEVDSPQQEGNCKVLTINKFGKAKQSTDLMLKGSFVDFIEWQEGYLMVCNFLSFRNIKGQQTESRAVGGSFNVLLAFYDKQLRLNSILPIFSETPIFALKVGEGADNSLKIAGRKGGFELNDKVQPIGGEQWEYLLE